MSATGSSESIGSPPKSPSDVSDSPDKVKFQLIPISESERPPVGEVIERFLKEGQTLRIGRQVIRDGQPVVQGQRKMSDADIWFTSKVVSRIHCELWIKENQLYIKDIGSSSGTFLNKMRLSPSGKESRPYPLKQGDVIQFGVDYKGKTEDLYRSITMKLGFFDQTWVQEQRKKTNPVRFRAALAALLAATNPYARRDTSDADTSDASTDCCICLGGIAPFQALFIAPCSHCYHYKCVRSLLGTSVMFQCPLCRQVANLTASVSTESLIADGLQEDTKSRNDWTPENTNFVDNMSSVNMQSTTGDWNMEPVTPITYSSRRHSVIASLEEDRVPEQLPRAQALETSTDGIIRESRNRAATYDGGYSSTINPSGEQKAKRRLSLTSKLSSFFSRNTTEQKKEKGSANALNTENFEQGSSSRPRPLDTEPRTQSDANVSRPTSHNGIPKPQQNNLSESIHV